jgi:hypothetical protein
LGEKKRVKERDNESYVQKEQIYLYKSRNTNL